MKRLILQPLLIAALFSSSVFADTSHVQVHLVGDSTMAEKRENKRPETGWGEKFHQHLVNKAQIRNHAKNGRSSKSFRDEGHWQAVLDSIQPGDFVLIQFGHNDQKAHDPKRFTRAEGEYHDNLVTFVKEVRLRKGKPLLLSSVVRRKFDETGSLVDTHGAYPDVVRRVAQEQQVDFVDLTQLSKQLVAGLGPKASKTLYLHLSADQHSHYPEGLIDNTHLSPKGASTIAKLVAASVCKQTLSLKVLMADCDGVIVEPE